MARGGRGPPAGCIGSSPAHAPTSRTAAAGRYAQHGGPSPRHALPVSAVQTGLATISQKMIRNAISAGTPSATQMAKSRQ